MLQEQIISISLDKGLDTKTNPKKVQGKVIALKDGVFKTGGSISKRNGNDALTKSISGGGTYTNPLMEGSLNNELLIAATASGASVSGQRLFGYNEDLSAWVDRGKYVSLEVSNKFISSSISQNLQGSSSATLGDITLVTWEAWYFNGSTYTTGSYFSIYSNTSGSFLLADQLIFGEGLPRAVLLGGTQLAVFYQNGPICFRTITVSGSSVTVGPETPMTVDPFPSWDIVETSTGAVVIGQGATAKTIGLQSVTSAGVIGTMVNISGATSINNAVAPISGSTDSAGNIWVYWCDNSTLSAEPMYYAVFNSSLGVVKAMTTIGTFAKVSQIAAYPNSATQQTVLYSLISDGAILSNSGTVQPVYSVIYSQTVNTTGTIGTQEIFVTGFELLSKPLAYNNTNYIALVSYSTLQSTGFLVDISDVSAIAKFNLNQAEGLISSNTRPFNVPNGYTFRRQSFLTMIRQQSSEVLQIASGFQINGQGLGVNVKTFDFGSDDAWQGVEAGQGIALNGGIVQLYDGASVTELGFNQFPDNIGGTSNNTGGNYPSGTYGLVVVYKWLDKNGNLYQASSNPISFLVPGSIGSGTNTITVQIGSCGLSQKLGTASGINVEVYLTAQGGTIAYRQDIIISGNRVSSVPLNSAAAYTQITLITGPSVAMIPVYTTGNVVENIAPPPSVSMTKRLNRLLLVNSENPETEAWYAKQESAGYGIQMSDLLTISIDSKLGKIRAIAEMDEKLVIFKQNGAFAMVGDGADDTGANSTFSFPQVIPTSIGCDNSRTCLTPGGLFFDSGNGIYLLDRSLSLKYIGKEVEAYNSQTITDIRIAPNTTEVRFLTDSGLTLVYDFLFSQWSTFTNFQGVSAANYNGKYSYVRTDGSVFVENATTFLDNGTAYNLTVLLEWIKVAGIQGFQRVRRLAILGDSLLANGHGIQVQASYDYGSPSGLYIPYSFVNSSGTFQYRERLPIQKCEALQLLIEEVTTGASGEFMSLSDLSLECGVKKGLYKLSSAQSVG